MKGLSIAVMFVLCLASCEKKNEVPLPEEEEKYGFSAKIGEKQVDVIHIYEEKLMTLQYGFIDQVPTYGLIINLKNENINNLGDTQLSFQLYDLQNKLYKIESHETYDGLRENWIILTKTIYNINTESVAYAPNPDKKAFEIRVTGIEYHDNGIIPTVTATMNGILYNLKNDQDSIIINNGDFRFRF